MNVRSRDWCFTTNNYSEEDISCLDFLGNDLVSSGIKYLCYGKEIAPTTKTKHLQGYVYFNNARSFKSAMATLPNGSHIEKCMGTAKQNKEYCEKEGEFVEYGELPEQGKRNDIAEVRDYFDADPNPSMMGVFSFAKNLQTIKIAEQYLKYHENPRKWKPIVYWYYGATGTGKSKQAYEECPNAYYAMDSIKWWEGYDAHEEVIIDDMRKDFASFNQLLKLLDRYAYRIEVKGASRQFLAKKIIITSCFHPSQLFSTSKEDIAQLLRRLDKIVLFHSLDYQEDVTHKNLHSPLPPKYSEELDELPSLPPSPKPPKKIIPRPKKIKGPKSKDLGKLFSQSNIQDDEISESQEESS